MKKILSILTVCFSAAVLPLLTVSCVEEMPEVIEELDLSRVLTPSSTAATVSSSDGCTVSFSWTNSNTATMYLIQIYRFEAGSAPASADEVTEETLSGMTPQEVSVAPSESGSSTSTSVKLDPEYSYYARVCGQNTAEGSGQADSDWAVFPYPIDTYTVMDPVESVTVTERTSSSVTVSWTLPAAEGDLGVNQLRVSPDPTDPESAYLAVPVEAGATSATVGGGEITLPASTRFTIAVHYNSANRGSVTAWTMPSLENPTVVETDEALQNALKDGAPEILVKYSDTPYSLTVTGEDGTETAVEIGVGEKASISVYGEGTASGELPTIVGGFTLPDGLTSFHLEGLNLDGDSYGNSHAIILAKDFATPNVSSISMLNCNVTAYKAGFFYDNETSGGAGVTIDNISFRNVYVSDILGSGGNGFDIRKVAAVNNISFTESTFADGFRTFVRIDAAAVQSLKFNNNTVNNVCFVDDGNNKGLFYIGAGKDQVKIPSFEMKDNVFLNLDGHDERTVFFSDATGVPTSVSSNYYYNLGPGFWEKDGTNADGKGKLSQSEGLAGGGVILTSDPCENSERGILNITSAAVLEAQAGDPRWFEAYVEQPDPDLVPVEYGYTWDLTDTDTFYDVIEESCVRGNTKFIVTSSPINVTEDGFEFTAEPDFVYSGTPGDCAMAFLVDGPGSVVLSAMADGSSNDHITVAYGPADGSSATVAGAAYAGAERTKVAFPDFMSGEQHLVYIYACGPVIMSELSWVEDTDTGTAPVLAVPSNLALSESSVDDTYSGTVTLTWDEVPYAGSYKVTVTDAAGTAAEYSVSVPSYDLNPSVLGPGSFTITVQAVPAETDLSREPSEVSEPVVFTVKETLKTVYAETSWGAADFEYLFNTKAAGSSGTEITEDFIYNNLNYIAGDGGKLKFGEDNSSVTGAKAFRVQLGGSGKPGTKQCLQFKVAGSGTLEVEVASSGDAARYLGVYVGETPVGLTDPEAKSGYEAPAKGSSAVHTVNVTAADGDLVNLVSMSSGLNIFSVTWTPEGFDPDAGIPSDPEAIEETADIISSFEPGVERILAPAGQSVTIDKVTYTAKSNKDIQWDGERIKLQGASEIDDSGMPVGNVISFKVTKPGTVKYYIRSGSSGDEQREVKIDLVKNGSEITNIYTGFAPTPGYKEGSESSVEITPDHLTNTDQSVTVNIYAPTNSVNVYYLEYILAQ